MSLTIVEIIIKIQKKSFMLLNIGEMIIVVQLELYSKIKRN